MELLGTNVHHVRCTLGITYCLIGMQPSAEILSLFFCFILIYRDISGHYRMMSMAIIYLRFADVGCMKGENSAMNNNEGNRSNNI